MLRSGPDCSQEPRTTAGFPKWLAGNQAPGPSSAVSQGTLAGSSMGSWAVEWLGLNPASDGLLEPLEEACHCNTMSDPVNFSWFYLLKNVPLFLCSTFWLYANLELTTNDTEMREKLYKYSYILIHTVHICIYVVELNLKERFLVQAWNEKMVNVSVKLFLTPKLRQLAIAVYTQQMYGRSFW